MAVEIMFREDRGAAVDSSGATTFTHVIQFQGNSLMEIMTSRLLPVRGSRHPQNSAFYLDSIDIEPIGNLKRGCQALATLTYSNGSELLRDFSGDPWDLGAQNFTSNHVSVSKPLLKGWQYIKGEGLERDQVKEVLNLNTAGSRILAETTENIREISFTYCVKAKPLRDFDGNDEPIINKKTEKVAGIQIPARTGLLLPLSASFITEYEGAGDKVRRQYWEVSATIQIKKSGWSKDELNIGTMCFYKDKTTGEVVRIPQAIFRYTPWVSSKDEGNIKVRPVFGSIDDVIRAKNTYAKKVSGYDPEGTSPPTGEQEKNYQSAWDKLPYEEVTEPMPLREDGTLFTEALEDPVKNPYLILKIYDAQMGSWNAFNLPRKRA
nr:MAG TPA: hypothetical protein [Caudoviricetes sp.]